MKTIAAASRPRALPASPKPPLAFGALAGPLALMLISVWLALWADFGRFRHPAITFLVALPVTVALAGVQAHCESRGDRLSPWRYACGLSVACAMTILLSVFAR